MKLELTQTELSECYLNYLNGGSDRNSVIVAINKALALAAAKIPEPPGWVQVSVRMPTEEDSVLGMVVWLTAKGSLVLTDWNHFFHGEYKPIAWHPLTKYTPQQPTPEEIEEAKFQEWSNELHRQKIQGRYFIEDDAMRHIWKSIRAIK